MGRRVLALLTSTLLLSALAVPLAAAPASAAPALPPGFVQTSRASGQTTEPLTAFALLPDGGMITTGKGGTVMWVSPDDSVTRQLSRITVRNTIDIGLVGLALAPDYATTGGVFTVYAYDDATGEGFHRLSEWRVDDPAAPRTMRSERVILDGIEVGSADMHGASDVVVDPDGTLWLSIGDAANAFIVDPVSLRALDLDSPHGKVLHLRRDGRGVASNPYYDAAAPASWRSRVYASGFRSPFRFTLDERTGGPILADVGWNRFEEINVLRPGASYGWPCWEGPEPTPGYKDLPGCVGVGHTPPAFSYPRAEGVSVTGGVFYQGDLWPQEYRGSYVFGDYASKRLWTAKIGAAGAVAAAPVRFGADIGGPVHFRTAPNGDVMYADIYTGKVVRLSYTAGNRTPSALVTTSTDPATRTVTFDGSLSSDLDGDALTYAWDFGDPGSTTDTATGAVATYTYPAGASFSATLTVTDLLGASGQQVVTVAPGNFQPVLVVEPALGTGPEGTFRVGDPVTLTATATDREDGDLPISWTSALVHCRGTSCHDHEPRTTQGASLVTVFGDHGGDSRLVARARATDSTGATATTEFVAEPSLRRLAVQGTTPALMTINGADGAAALVVEGSRNSLTAPVTATDGVSTFSRWADGGTDRLRQVVMGAGDVSLTAVYETPVDRRLAADPAARALLGEPVSTELGSTDLRWRDFQGGRAYWTPTAGVRLIGGAILRTYLELGGHVSLGAPLTDELITPDRLGRFNHLAGGSSVYWTPGTGAHGVGGAIRERWAAQGWEAGPLGYPLTSEFSVGDGVGRYNDFSGGHSIYWSPATGARTVGGAIRQSWQANGGTSGPLGYPVTDELSTPDRVGRYNHFSKAGSVYWTTATGAHAVSGGIRERWAALGWETGPLGYPLTDELGTPDRVGRYTHFSKGGSLYWTQATGTRAVVGAIRERWAAQGWEAGPLGYPVTDELVTPDGVGRYNHFSKGASVYWTRGTGAHSVQGAIRARWAALGWERSYLGYPTRSEYAVPTGRRSDFQRGTVTWASRNGAVTDRRY